ncbi:endonuclease [uncultured Jatrophihabitans sp.]|uniref:endonuclease n=1 Tax=uncultured Jatrophihabitans sp. TaxID=1610747 RepID=UPI0035CC4221
MSASSDIRSLLDEHGSTFAEEAGITLKDTPAPLFRLLVLTSLLSANLDPRLGLRTARALGDAGLTTAAKLRDAGQDTRWQLLTDSKYLRTQQTARQLGQLAEEAQDRYGGDLRRLRDGSDDVTAIRDAIQAFTCIGPLGVDIFCREVQAVWPGLRPFADRRVLELARKRGLPADVTKLARAAGTDDLSRVGAALLFADMADRRA